MQWPGKNALPGAEPGNGDRAAWGWAMPGEQAGTRQRDLRTRSGQSGSCHTHHRFTHTGESSPNSPSHQGKSRRLAKVTMWGPLSPCEVPSVAISAAVYLWHTLVLVFQQYLVDKGINSDACWLLREEKLVRAPG